MIETHERDTRLFPDEAYREELARRGSAIYASKLKALLEPEQDGRFVAIHVDSERYATGRSSAEAIRALIGSDRPDGRLFICRIGDEPDYALSHRILAGEAAPRSAA